MKIDFLTKPELLAPAGSFDCLKAAVQNGADAVYVGLKTGSARMGAENFSIDELREAVAYAHVRGVRVFLAFNTLIFEDEFQQAYDLTKEAADTGIDALILQDLGLARRILANKAEFGCEIHASTQMSVYNKEGVQILKKLGFDRCITARELSIKEISELCKENLLEIEVFCHGALCMSVSGQCLMSSFIGGRSGNRGTCAQPCRQKYSLSTNEKDTAPAYRLSPADFASLPHLKELIEAGVHSLKIEGRLKSPSYVAAVTRSYREAIDSIFEDRAVDISKSMRDMQVLFGRGDFTSGYLKGKLPFKDITFRSAGRVGLPIGTLKSSPVTLPSPKGLPNKLSRYYIEVITDKNLSIGDGITVYSSEATEQKIICGGTVNAIEKNGKITKITLVGNIISKPTQSKSSCILTLTDDSALRKSIELSTNTESHRTPIFMRFSGNTGNLPILEVFDNDGNICQAKGAEPLQTAQKAPTTAEEIKKQLSKLGDTPFYVAEISVNIESNIFIPVSALNAMRRCAVSELTQMRTKRKKTINAENTQKSWPPRNKDLGGGISLFFYTTKSFLEFNDNNLPQILHPYKNESKTYYIPMDGFAQALDKIQKTKSRGNCKIIVYFPFISLGNALENTKKSLAHICENYLDKYIDGFMLQNLGDFSTLGSLNTTICCDYSFNISNIESLAALSEMSVSRATLSVESAENMLKSHTLPQNINTEILVGGPIVLMRSRHCYIDEGECGGKFSKCTKASYALKDTKGATFPILPQKDDCCSILLSHKPVTYSESQIKKIRSANPNVTLRVNIL